jgi:hypothetical protein
MRSSFSLFRGLGVVAVVLAASCGDGGSSPTPATGNAGLDAGIGNDADAGAEDETSTPTPPADGSTDAMRDDAAPDAGADRSTNGSVDAGVDATVVESGARDGTPIEAADLDAGAVEAGEGGVVEGGPLPPVACDGPGSRFASDIVSYRFGDGQDFGQTAFPGNVFGPPKGEGSSNQGSLDVVSLGNGGTVTVAFSGNAIVDGIGPDFLVFENAFNIANDPSRPYAELGIVEVSQDGTNWVSFPCTATSYPYGTCAGWHPVFANPDKNQIDPTDPTVAGGDPFDLADVGLPWARQVRITDRTGDALTFDLDAVAIVHPMCP